MKTVIIGQGYVGLPLALAAAESGHTVLGMDINSDLVKGLNSGHSHVEDVDNSRLSKMLISGNYRATSNPEEIAECNVIIIAVPTPLDSNRNPDLSSLISACETIAKFAQPRTLVINESTSYPGTLRSLISQIISNGSKDFYFSVSPERVDPGNKKWKIKNTPRLFSGLDVNATNLTREFYSRFCENLIEVDSPEIAESAKLFENTFRQVNIALVNEFAEIMNSLKIPVHPVLDAAASKPYGFMKFAPGIGVGGHCIPVDPSYLAHASSQAGVDPQFIKLANEVNYNIPAKIVKRFEDRLHAEVANKTILIAGIAYKENVSDLRESPSIRLYELLVNKGANVYWCDPNVKSWRGMESVAPSEMEFDAVILTVAHDQFMKNDFWPSNLRILDLTGKFPQFEQI